MDPADVLQARHACDADARPAIPSVFSTQGLPPRDQFDAWQAWHAPMVETVASPHGPGAGFAAESRLWLLDGMAIGLVRSPGLGVICTSAHCRRDPVDHWVLTIGLGTTTQVVVGGMTHAVPARVPFLASLGEACESQRARDERLHLYIARDRFPALTGVLDSLRGPLAGPLATLLADYLDILRRALPDLSATDLKRLPAAIAGMVACCIDTAALPEPQAAAQIDHALRHRIRQVVRRRLRSPSLGPLAICRELGISRSRLYRLLEDEGGVARYIQNLRLDACHAALADAEDTRTIGTIAEQHGFYDPSSFSRVFRRRFARPPGEVRAAALVGLAPPPPRFGPAAGRLATLRDCLRLLR